MAQAVINKRLCMQVGTYVQNGKPKAEWREVGVELEFTDDHGNSWTEIKLHAELLNPAVLSFVRRFMEEGTAAVRIKKFDPTRRMKTPDAGGDGPPGAADDGHPF